MTPGSVRKNVSDGSQYLVERGLECLHVRDIKRQVVAATQVGRVQNVVREEPLRPLARRRVTVGPLAQAEVWRALYEMDGEATRVPDPDCHELKGWSWDPLEAWRLGRSTRITTNYQEHYAIIIGCERNAPRMRQ